MQRFLLLVLAIGFSSTSCLLNENSTETAYISSNWPDQIVLNLPEDPSRGVNISWRTSDQIKKGFVSISSSDSPTKIRFDADYLEMDTRRVVRVNNDLVTHRFFLKIDGLTPNTQYTYQACSTLQNEEYCSEDYTFLTAPSQKNENFSFMYLGDAQNGLEQWSKNYAAKIAEHPEVRFTVLAGDLVDDGLNRAEFDTFFGEAPSAFASVGFLPAIGNHEYLPMGPLLYKRQFVLPENGPSKAEASYWIEYGSALIVVMNSNNILNLKKQAKWLDGVLGRSSAKWKIVTFHHPIWSSHPKRDNRRIRKRWTPLFEKHGVHLVLTGHDHAYMRTFPLIKGTPVEKGPIYVVSYSGSKSYESVDRPIAAKSFAEIPTYQLINISPEKLTYSAYSWDDELKDELVIED